MHIISIKCKIIENFLYNFAVVPYTGTWIEIGG